MAHLVLNQRGKRGSNMKKITLNKQTIKNIKTSITAGQPDRTATVVTWYTQCHCTSVTTANSHYSNCNC